MSKNNNNILLLVQYVSTLINLLKSANFIKEYINRQVYNIFWFQVGN